MGFILVNQITDRCYTNEDGEMIKRVVIENMKRAESSVLSFKGIDSVSSSFVNSAFIDLLDMFTFEEIKLLVSFTDTNRSINSVIKSRFDFEVNNRKKLINV